MYLCFAFLYIYIYMIIYIHEYIYKSKGILCVFCMCLSGDILMFLPLAIHQEDVSRAAPLLETQAILKVFTDVTGGVEFSGADWTG